MSTASIPTYKIKKDAIVISGISGLFPSANNTLELSEKLYNKVDMVSSNVNPDIKHPEVPQHCGKINGIRKFDSQFFRMTPNQAISYEPCGRKLLEEAYAAIFDAGVNPETLKGSKLGVFVGFSQADCGIYMYDDTKYNGFVITGSNKSMMANRISYWINAQGPSYGIDVGCTSSMACLQIACQSIHAGECDAALVAGLSYVSQPKLTLNLKRAGFLCLDGKTKCFAKNGDGYVRSETVSVLFLQKAKDAKRIYSEICHVKGSYASKLDSSFLPIRLPEDIQIFLEEFYNEVDIKPDDVEYIEANATGIAEADRSELEGISKVFGKKLAVKIGSIKSNLGHTECASGVVGIIKACLAYQKGILPANLHYTEQLDVSVIKDKKCQVITENTSFERGYIAINNFGFPGTTYHALLKGHFIPKDIKSYRSEIPRLILVSGRHEEGVNKVFDILKNNKIDPEQIALLNNIFRHDIPGHTGRGFAIFDCQENVSGNKSCREFQYFSGTKRPVCFMYSGMGSQWVGMAKQLMQIPMFAATITKLHKVLEPRGLNLVNLITNEDSGIVTNILYSFVGITAVQIGLTDILNALGVTPDLIIGHSLGEIGCAYADGCFTSEQTILSSYYRGYVSANTKFIKGKMAAIGLGHIKVEEIMPEEIEIACHNSSESTTISGPADIVENFVESLTERKIFAKNVASSDIAFHSRYIRNAGQELLCLTNNLIKEPKHRSKKWISTSYMPEEWNLEESQLASGEYFTHNLLSKVCFEEGARYIPNDAIIIEIAPHGLMQAILKKSHAKCVNLPLLRRDHDYNVNLFLKAIGKLYTYGLNPKIEALYPKIDFPVSTETPGLSHFVQWDHSSDWKTRDQKPTSSERKALYAEYIISVFDDEYSYIRNYFRNGKNVFPESALLELVWKTLAMYNDVNYTDLSVEFKNIKFHDYVLIKSTEVIKLCISVQKACNTFEVTLDDKLIVSGIINKVYNNTKSLNEIKFTRDECYLDKKDVNKFLNIRGYNIGIENFDITATNADMSKAIIKWQNKWRQLIDSLLLLNILSESEYTFCKIKYISSLAIDVNNHNYSLMRENTEDILYAEHNTEKGVTRCGGVICKSIFYSKICSESTTVQVLSQRFIPHCNYHVDMETAVNVNLQIIFENSPKEKLTIKLVQTEQNVTNFNVLRNVTSKMSLFEIELDVIECNDLVNVNFNNESIDAIIFSDYWSFKLLQNDLVKILKESSFVLLVGLKHEIDLKCLVKNGIASITSFDVDNKEIILLKKTKDINLFKNSIISSSLHHLKCDLQRSDQINTIFILENKSFINSSSYKDTVKYILRKGNAISLLDVDEVSLLPFNNNIIFKRQVEKGLAINILRNEQWGGYYNVPLKSDLKIQNVKLTTKQNNFDTFRWTEMATVSKDNSVQVHYSSLCMKDCKDILHEKKKKKFGMDFSGVNSIGRRVMGCVPGGAISSSVQADPDLLWPVPKHWSLEDAATVPLPYIHAYYCLTIKHVLKSKSTVLVMGGAGALGQAIISLCLNLDCEIFTTVSNKQKKTNLMKMFPQLNENNIKFSMNTEFRDYVLYSTKGERCDVVINCNVGVIRQNALACVGVAGYFLDISEEYIKNGIEYFGMSILHDSKSYITVCLSSLFTEANTTNKKRLRSMIAEGIAKGIVKPLPRTVFPRSDISQAFKLMATRQHTGRVSINMSENTSGQIGESRLTLNPNKVYIVICDGSEIGVEIINRLIKRGAKKLIIQNTEKSHNGYYQSKYLQWRKLINIEYYDETLNNTNGCKILIECGSKISPIDGIIYISSSSTNDNTQNTDDLILSNLDFACRHITSLSYFVSIKLVPYKLLTEDVFAEVDQRISEREKLGLPSLNLKCRFKEMNLNLSTITAFLDGFEKCLKYKNGHMLLLDQTCVKKDTSDIAEFVNSTKSMQFTNDKLNMFIDEIEKDEDLAMEPIVSMKTLTSEFYEDEINVDPDDHQAIVISGFLGNCKTLSMATERLKISALGLQILPDMDGSISNLAEQLLQYVKRRFRLKSKFYIVAYSFGVNVALEMAALLEEEGYHGIVFCLDSSPLALQHQIKAYLGHLTENHLQDFIIDQVYLQLTGSPSQILKEELEKCENWADKNMAFINNIKKIVSLSHNYLTDLINSIYKRILLAIEYKPVLKLKSEIVLIKGLQDSNTDKLPDDYDLTRYATKPVKIVNVTSDHVSVPKDHKISSIINGMLDFELLKNFEKKNLCEKYSVI